MQSCLLRDALRWGVRFPHVEHCDHTKTCRVVAHLCLRLLKTLTSEHLAASSFDVSSASLLAVLFAFALDAFVSALALLRRTSRRLLWSVRLLICIIQSHYCLMQSPTHLEGPRMQLSLQACTNLSWAASGVHIRHALHVHPPHQSMLVLPRSVRQALS